MDKMKRKERLCRKMSRVCESVAAILIGFGISIDSDEIVPTAMLLMAGCGIVFAICAVLLQKFSFYYKREAKRSFIKEKREEKRRQIIFGGKYTKISA